MKSSEDRISISKLAEQLDISPHTIRFYEDMGLILPRRTTGNQRIYSARDRARMKLILRGKRFGFSLTEIAEMIGPANADLNEISQIEKTLAYGEKKLAEIWQRKADLDLLEKDLLSIREMLLERKASIMKKNDSARLGVCL